MSLDSAAQPPVSSRAERVGSRWSTPSIPVGVLIILGLIATAVSLTGSWIPSFWGDEAASVMSAERTWSELWPLLGRVDAVHGLYYAFLHVWIDLFGSSVFSVRLPSAIAVGAATVGVAVLGSRLSTRTVGVVSAIIFLTLPAVTYYGMETRAYAFTMVFAVWLTLALITLTARRELRVWPWVGFGVAFAVSVILFIYALLFIVTFAAIVVLMRPGKAVLFRAGAVLATGAVIALPVVYFAYLQRNQIAFLHSRNGIGARQLFQAPWFTDLWPALLGWALILVALIATVLCWWRVRRGGAGWGTGRIAEVVAPRSPELPSLAVIAAVWVVVPSLLLAVATAVIPLYSQRYLAFSAPAIALLMGLGIVVCARLITRRFWAIVVLIAVVVAVSAPTYLAQRTPHPRNGGVDWNSIAQTIGERAEPGDAIIFDPTTIDARQPRLAQYMYPEAFVGLDDIALKKRYSDTNWLWDEVYGLDATMDRVGEHQRLWLVIADPRFSKNEAKSRSYLPALEERGFTVVDTVTHHRSTIYELQR